MVVRELWGIADRGGRSNKGTKKEEGGNLFWGLRILFGGRGILQDNSKTSKQRETDDKYEFYLSMIPFCLLLRLDSGEEDFLRLKILFCREGWKMDCFCKEIVFTQLE